MTRSGYATLTVNWLAAAVGRTRPTLYKYLPNAVHLSLDFVDAHYSTRPTADTELLCADLLAPQRQDLAMFSDPLAVTSLLGLLAAVGRDQLLAGRIRVELMDTRRRAISQAVEATCITDADHRAIDHMRFKATLSQR